MLIVSESNLQFRIAAQIFIHFQIDFLENCVTSKAEIFTNVQVHKLALKSVANIGTFNSSSTPLLKRDISIESDILLALDNKI